MAEQFKQMFVTEDGKQFESKAEAVDYLRRPLVIAELGKVTNGDSELNTFIYESMEAIEDAFSAGTIKRVTKAERKLMEKAIDAVVTDCELNESGKATANKDYAFIAENANAIKESFRWPTVARLKPEEKEASIKEELLSITEGRVDLSDWIIQMKDQIFACFEAGKVKREVAPQAAAGLEIYREMVKERKALQEAVKFAKTYIAPVEAVIVDDVVTVEAIAEHVVDPAAVAVAEKALAVFEAKVAADKAEKEKIAAAAKEASKK